MTIRDIKGMPTDLRLDEMAGIELHLDRLLFYIAEGYLKASIQEVDMLKSLSERVGGYTHALDSPAHAIDYKTRLERMMSRLGGFYYGAAS